VKVEIIYKCPQINTIKFLEHQSFEVGGFCTLPSWSMHHNITRWPCGLFCEKNKIRGFLDVKVEMIYKCPQINAIKFLVHESFEVGGFFHMAKLVDAPRHC